MTRAPGGSTELVQLRYLHTEHELESLSATDFVAAVQGAVSLVEACAEAGAYGELRATPEVRVGPPKSGSVIIDVLVTVVQDNSDQLLFGGVPSVGALTLLGLKRLLKKNRGEMTDFDYLPNGNVKISWAVGPPEEVTHDEWKLFSQETRKTRKALEGILAPLRGDANRLEARDADPASPAQKVVATPEDVVALDTAVESQALPYDLDIVTKVNMFRSQPSRSWGINTQDGPRTASMEDEEFGAKLASGLRVSENDEFTLVVRVEPKEYTGAANDKYRIVKVRDFRRAETRGGADDEPPLPLP